MVVCALTTFPIRSSRKRSRPLCPHRQKARRRVRFSLTTCSWTKAASFTRSLAIRAGINDARVRSSADETVLLGNGCLCCITRTDLQQALRRMVVERERGELPDFRRIVIETSGLADPSPILQTFATDRALGGIFHVDAVVTVVDAVTGGDTLQWSAEARKQAILADRLIVTKTDIAGEGASASLAAQLRTLNHGAEIHEAINGAIDPTRLTEPAADQRNTFVAEA